MLAFLRSFVNTPSHSPPFFSVPIEWLYCAQGIYDHPLQIRYPNLPPGNYSIDVVYACDAGMVECQATSAGGTFRVHPLMEKPLYQKKRFHIPVQATRILSDLTITFSTTPGIGGNGRASQVAEIWLVQNVG